MKLIFAIIVAAAGACSAGSDTEDTNMTGTQAGPAPAGVKVATFGGGCFWCMEAVFDRLLGVLSVESGYSGGHVDNPTYKEVSSGETGHAEAIEISYDPSVVSYAQLLEVFLKTHDPTTKDRQGGDEGPQYRSVIFWHDEEQRRTAEEVIRALDAAGVYGAPIVTEVVPCTKFWPAEQYHQEYFDRNPNQGYCQIVIAPKIEMFEKVFSDRLKRK